jgi:DNA-binding beta-propeller fold protein YncE
MAQRPLLFDVTWGALVAALATPAWSATISKGTVSHPGGNFCTYDTLATFVSGGEDVIVIFGDEVEFAVASIWFSPPEAMDVVTEYNDTPNLRKIVTVSRNLDPGQQYHVIYSACGTIPSGYDTYEIVADACSAPPPPPPALDCYWRDMVSLKPLVRWPTTLVGYPVQRWIQIENTGFSPLDINLGVSCSEFNIVGNTSVSVPVGGGPLNIGVRFDPSTEETFVGEMAPQCGGYIGLYPGGSLLLGSAIGPRLVVGTQAGILRRQIDGSADIELGTGATQVDMAFSQSSDLFLARQGGSTPGIFRGNLDGDFTQIAAPIEGWCVDFDPIMGQVYWAGDDGFLWNAWADGSDADSLSMEFPIGAPVDIALHSEIRMIFWTSVGASETWIWGSNLDGTNKGALVQIASGGNPRLALDTSTNWLYWSEDTTSRIRRMRLDGTQVQTMLTPDIDVPVGLAIDAAAQQLYWADAGTNSVHRVDLNGENHVELMTGTTGLNGLLLLVPPHQESELLYLSDTTHDRLRRMNKDGTGAADLISGLADPRGVALDADAGKLYWIDAATDRISRANVDGTGVEPLVTTGLVSPEDIALDVAAGKMYWTDSGIPNRIQRANLNGTGVETLIDSGLSGVRGIAVDPAGGKMYWTETTSRTIRRATMAPASTPELVLGGRTYSPIDIALDVTAGEMYWTETTIGGAGPGVVWRATFGGSDIVPLWASGLGRAGSITLDLGTRKLYFTMEHDVGGGQLAGVIHRRTMDAGTLDVQQIAWLEEPASGLAVAPRPGFPTTSDTGDDAIAVPRIRLDAPRPNPFNPSTRFSYVHAGGALDVSIYDVSGRLVRTLVSGAHPAGSGTLAWEGKDDAGRSVPSGLYLVKLTSSGQNRSVKAVLVR